MRIRAEKDLDDAILDKPLLEVGRSESVRRLRSFFVIRDRHVVVKSLASLLAPSFEPASLHDAVDHEAYIAETFQSLLQVLALEETKRSLQDGCLNELGRLLPTHADS